jgi:hypothetical protein
VWVEDQPTQNTRYRRPQRNGNQTPEKVFERVTTGTETLLVKVKVHRENPLNHHISGQRWEDLRTPLKSHGDPTERIVYKWTGEIHTRSKKTFISDQSRKILHFSCLPFFVIQDVFYPKNNVLEHPRIFFPKTNPLSKNHGLPIYPGTPNWSCVVASKQLSYMEVFFFVFFDVTSCQQFSNLLKPISWDTSTRVFSLWVVPVIRNGPCARFGCQSNSAY